MLCVWWCVIEGVCLVVCDVIDVVCLVVCD